MKRTDFNYELPPELIAQQPLPQRSDSRLLVLEGAADRETSILHRHFRDLPEFLRPEDLLVFNDTRVIPARLWGQKETGGKLELLIERVTGTHTALAHIRASKSPKPGTKILLSANQNEAPGAYTLVVSAREGDLFSISCPEETPLSEILEAIGHMPLPPYIERGDQALDRERYQTVYARREGAVAAPTAGLHFTEELLARTDAMGVRRAHITLHVGAGTFQPVRADDIEQHVMHREYIEVDEDVVAAVQETRTRGGRIVAVGTTAVRALESASQAIGGIQAFTGDTDIFIYAGYRFRSVDAMITNFHLPESTLLMLVSAFAGRAPIMAAYAEAIERRYRFFSYGDAMLLLPQGRA